MAPQKTITINGRIYDAITGLPVETTKATSTAGAATAKPAVAKPAAKPAVKPAVPVAKPTPAAGATTATKTPRPAATPRPDVIRAKKPAGVPTATKTVKPVQPAKKAPATPRADVPATNVHTSMQRSQTLNRRVAKKPAVRNRPVTNRPTVGKQMDVAKSAAVSRFAKDPVVATATTTPVRSAPVKPDAPAKTHPVAERAISRTRAKTKKAGVTTPKPAKPAKTAPKPATAKQIKEAAIAKALNAPAAPKKKTAKPARKSQKHLRRIAIIAGVIVFVVAAFFAVYRLFPGISVSFAASQAGISATYPEFTPDGYSLDQPVTYEDGEIVLRFASHSNDNYYTVTQTRSTWDSSAVLDNVVTPVAGADYITTKERGLTIYSYDSVAVWVNGGILYKIDSKAPLSGDQIRKIATSL